MILLDASGLFAYLNEPDAHRESIQRVFDAEQGSLVMSPFVLGELDYLMTTRVDTEAELALLDDVVRGAYSLVEFSSGELADARAIIARYADLKIGLADASIVVLAGKLGCSRVLTLDERHFRALRTPAGDPFVVLPADS